MKETKKLKKLVLLISEMPIKNILERDDILPILEKKNLLVKYKNHLGISFPSSEKTEIK